MRWAWPVLTLLCGCDVIWRLDHVTPDAGRGEVQRFISPGDFDGDGRPNDGDPCPYLPAPAADLDGDGDGVGDGCDPNPATPGDCFVLFDGFAELDPRWSADATNSGVHYPWSICTDPGEPVFCSPRPATTSWLFFTGEIDRATRVRAFGVVWTVSAQATASFGVSLDMAPATLQYSGEFCEVKHAVTGAVTLAIETLAMGATSNIQTQPSALPFDNAHPFLLDWDGTSCAVATTGGLETLTAPQQPAAGSYVGLRIDRADLNLLWLAALKTGCE